MSSVTQATDFLVKRGAKQVNLYERAGRVPQLRFTYKGEEYRVKLPETAGADDGAGLVPQLRSLLAASLAKPAALAGHLRGFGSGGARLRHVREAAALSRGKLAVASGIDVLILKRLEDEEEALEPTLGEGAIAEIAALCRADPNWLAGRVIVAPPVKPEAAPPMPPTDPALPPLVGERRLIGVRLRQAREQKRSTLAALGKALGISGAVVCNAEAGRSSGVFDRLIETAAALDIDPYWLRTGEGLAPLPPVPTPPTPVKPQPAPSPALDYAAIGARIKEARLRRSRSQVWLGEKLGYSPIPVLNAEKGRPSGAGVFRLLPQIAKALRVDLAWLEGGALAAEETPLPNGKAAPPPSITPPPAPADHSAALHALEQRLDHSEKQSKARHEELRLQLADAMRYIKATHALVAKERLPQAPAKREKSPRRVAAGKRAWATRFAGTAPTKPEIPLAAGAAEPERGE